MADKIQRVRIYVNEQDTWEDKPLYIAVLEHLQREGATGATVIQGVGGFGPGYRQRASSMGDPGSKVPLVIEWVERAERVTEMLPSLDELVPDALITLEDIRVYRAMLRSQGHFGSDQTAGSVMQPSPQTIGRDAQLGRAIALMLSGNQSLLPVLDDHKKLVGVITEVEIARRAGLRVPLRLLPFLTKEEGSELFGSIAGRLVNDVMSTEWRSIHMAASIPQALVIMIEWNYDQIPVLDRDNTMQGLLSWSDVLLAAINRDEESHDQSGVRNVDEPTPVSLVMRPMVPKVEISQPPGAALKQLFETEDRYLVVVDGEDHVRGSLSDIGVFRQLDSAERASLLAVMQSQQPLDPAIFANARYSLEKIMDRSLTTISPRESITDAVRRLMEVRVDSAPVVDEENRLLGLITRGGLLRAIVQES